MNKNAMDDFEKRWLERLKKVMADILADFAVMNLREYFSNLNEPEGMSRMETNNDDPDYIKSMSVLQVKPCDLIIIKCQFALSPKAYERLRDSIVASFRAHGINNPIVVLEDGLDIGVIRGGG